MTHDPHQQYQVGQNNECQYGQINANEEQIGIHFIVQARK